jgi:hypothetical protein
LVYRSWTGWHVDSAFRILNIDPQGVEIEHSELAPRGDTSSILHGLLDGGWLKRRSQRQQGTQCREGVKWSVNRYILGKGRYEGGVKLRE